MLKTEAGQLGTQMQEHATKKYKVLIVDNSPALTGAYKSISAIACALRDEFDFIFCLPSNSALQRPSGKLRPTVTLPFVEIKKRLTTIFYPPLLLLNSIRLLWFIRANQIDVLHVNDLYNLTGVVVKWMSPKVRLVYHVRLLPTAYSGMLYPFWLSLIKKYSDEIICVSQVAKERLGGSERCNVVSDAIDAAQIPFAAKTDDGVRTLNLLYLANYTKGKGQDHAIRAFASACRSVGRLRLWFVGGDLGVKKNIEFKKRLMALAIHEKVADKVIFDGFAADTTTLFRQADIFLNFSDSESFSLTCLEALMHGVPVIATDSGGPAELFEPGISGILVPVGDMQAMSQAMVNLSIDHVLRQNMAKKGRRYASEKFSLTTSSEQLKNIYLRLLARRSADGSDQ